MKKPLTVTGAKRLFAKIEKAAHDLTSMRIDLRKRCPHDWKYCPDPSGNNDSEYVCLICGQTTRRRP